jgi:hypothetical protein
MGGEVAVDNGGERGVAGSARASPETASSAGANEQRNDGQRERGFAGQDAKWVSRRVRLTGGGVVADRSRTYPAAAHRAQPGRFATKSISTSASRASAVTPMQVRAGSASAGK